MKFTAARILSLSGQGSIYRRPKEDTPDDDEEGSYSPGAGTVFSESSDTHVDFSSPFDTSQEQVLKDNRPCSSSSSSTSHDENKTRLKEMFPNKDDSVLCHALEVDGTVDRAALSLSANTNEQ